MERRVSAVPGYDRVVYSGLSRNILNPRMGSAAPENILISALEFALIESALNGSVRAQIFCLSKMAPEKWGDAAEDDPIHDPDVSGKPISKMCITELEAAKIMIINGTHMLEGGYLVESTFQNL
jgi:hypothetical protein